MHYNPEKRAWKGKSYKKPDQRVTEIRDKAVVKTDKKIACGHCGGGGRCGHCAGADSFFQAVPCKECDGLGVC